MAGKKFINLAPTADIDNLLGAAENSDGVTPGNWFTYKKSINTAAPSDAVVLTEGAIDDIAIYSNPLPTTTAVGGIPAGSNFFNTPKSFDDFISAAAYAYLNPSFTAFDIYGAVTQEVGQKIVGIQAFTWTINNVGNVVANSINIYDTIIPQPLMISHSVTSPALVDFSTLPGGGVVVLSSYPGGTPTAGAYTWQIEGTNTNLAIFNRNYSLSWMWRMHSGMDINPTLSNAQILSLANSSLTTTFPTQVTTAGGGYFHYLIPTSFIQPTVFKNHATGFSIDMNSPVVVSVTNVFGVTTNYTHFVSTDIQNNTTVVDVS